jgi:hypothetical protein
VTETPLEGGWVTEGVVRVGDTVRRPRGANAERVERLLEQLEAAGFEAAPRFLGSDDTGRTILSFIEGDVRPKTRCFRGRWRSGRPLRWSTPLALPFWSCARTPSVATSSAASARGFLKYEEEPSVIICSTRAIGLKVVL